MTVAVIGCGYWGKNLVRNFNQLDALVAVCDATVQGREVAMQLAPETKLVSDYGSILSSEIPAVAIATPAETHYGLVLDALIAGERCLCRKTSSPNL